LKGKSAVITGSSRGIGAEIASLFASEGASVIVNCDKSIDEAKRVTAAIAENGGVAEMFVADVRVPEQADALIEKAVSSYGRIDILVNNAGIVRDSMLENMTFDQWNEVIATNLTGVYNCSQSAAARMKASGGGKIVNMSSVVAEMGNIGQANYASSKAGVIGLTRALAVEYARHKVLVNAIAPGFCTTSLVLSLPDNVKEKVLAKIPLRRFGSPREIAYAALFLSSEESNYITGQVIPVNGGLHV